MATLTKQRQTEIDEHINRIRLQTGMSYPDNSLLDIARAMGVQVFEIDLSEQPDVSGVIQYKNDEGTPKPVLFINRDHPTERKAFTLAHELGHFVLHPHADKFRVDRFDYSQPTAESIEETEANYFAASLLVPKDRLEQIQKVSKGDIAFTAKYFGVSKPVIENRLSWLKSNQ